MDHLSKDCSSGLLAESEVGGFDSSADLPDLLPHRLRNTGSRSPAPTGTGGSQCKTGWRRDGSRLLPTPA